MVHQKHTDCICLIIANLKQHLLLGNKTHNPLRNYHYISYHSEAEWIIHSFLYEMCMLSFSNEAVGFHVNSVIDSGCRLVILSMISVRNILTRTIEHNLFLP
uniref:Uncharacterized protein n=2 Tax=Cercopithecinae TaxID=9528 RepID=A0A2K5KQB6_CERAT